MRVDTQTRTWRTVDGTDVEIVVQWAKHMHPNGTYNWVTVGPGGAIVEVERESHWDYPAGRAPPNSGITTGGSPHERAPDPSWLRRTRSREPSLQLRHHRGHHVTHVVGL